MLQIQADQLQLHEYLQLQLITCHLPFTSDNSVQSFRNISNLFFDKMLRNMGLPVINQLFCGIIILMWIFVKMLLNRLLAIFDGGKIR